MSRVSRDWALAASSGVWSAAHVEWREQPLLLEPPKWDGTLCPGDDSEGVGARGLARALGVREPPFLPTKDLPVPLFFLTYEELKAFYRRPACARFFFPRDTHLYELGMPQWRICTDDAPLSPLGEDGVEGRGCRMFGAHKVPCELPPKEQIEAALRAPLDAEDLQRFFAASREAELHHQGKD